MNAITIKITNEVAPYPSGTKQTNKTTIVKDKDLTPIPTTQYRMSPTSFERICVIIDWKSEKTMGE